MKAALCKSFDGPQAIVIEDVAVPQAVPGEAIVAVKAVALNFLDVLICRGKYQYKPELPFSPAAEVSGVILSIGENATCGEGNEGNLGQGGASGFKVGQRVCAYLGWGGAREQVAVAIDRLSPLPDAVSHEVAAGINVTYGTALHALKDRGQLAAGETIAVLGASGGAGLAAVEIARRMGARVIAAASGDDRLQLCKAQGADELLNYTTTDLRDGLRQLTGGKGVDLVYDCIGGDYAEAALRAISWQGRYLVVGFASGQIPRMPLNLTLLKGCDIRGVFWGRAVEKDPAGHRANMAALLDWIAAGDVTPHIHGAYPLQDIGAAIGLLEQRKAQGKVIVTL